MGIRDWWKQAVASDPDGTETIRQYHREEDASTFVTARLLCEYISRFGPITMDLDDKPKSNAFGIELINSKVRVIIDEPPGSRTK